MKKYLLALAAMLAISGINAQRTAKPHQPKFSTTFSEANNLKRHIKDCYAAINGKYQLTDLAKLRKALTKFGYFNPFNQEVGTMLYKEYESQFRANLVKLDTVQNGFFKDYKSTLMAKGYEYATTCPFPNAHIDYDIATKKWTVTKAENDVQITYTEANGVKTVITILPKSDKFVSALNIDDIEQLKPTTNKVFTNMLMCSQQNVKLVSNGETLISGDITGTPNFVQAGIAVTNQSSMNLDINGCILKYQKNVKDKNGERPLFISLSREGKEFISTSFKNKEEDGSYNFDMKDLTFDLAGKIQLRGNMMQLETIYKKGWYASNGRDSSAQAAYVDALNKYLTLGYYYDGAQKKMGDNRMYLSASGNGSYTILPEIKLAGQDKYVPFTQYLTDKKDGNLYVIFRSFIHDINFGLINAIGSIKKAAVMLPVAIPVGQ